MKNPKLLVIVLCLITGLVVIKQAEAWTWKGFSDLCVEGSYRGPEGYVVFTLENVSVYTQCDNINTGAEVQPGTGNLGLTVLQLDALDDPTKSRGIVSIDGCIDLAVFDDHDYHDPGPDLVYDTDDDIYHIHTCTPLDNKNKEEVLGSAWIQTFVANWWMYDDKGRLINQGTDDCTWPGTLDEYGIPDHDVPFECTSTSDKKINWYQEK